MNLSLNLSAINRPPDFGPQFPTYPELPQLVRVFAGSVAIIGPKAIPVYAALTQQYLPPLMTRDREPCYVLEPNGIPLGAAIYDCRLIGSFLGPSSPKALPLYATTCCTVGLPQGSSSGSPSPITSSLIPGSSSSMASLPPLPIRTPLGTAKTSGFASSLSVALTTEAGLLVVIVTTTGGTGNASVQLPSCLYNGVPLTLSLDQLLPGGAPTTGGIWIFFGTVAAMTAILSVQQNLSATGETSFMLAAVNVTGLTGGNTDDIFSAAANTSGSPDAGLVGPTNVPVEYAQGGFQLITADAPETWQNGFIAGQSIADTIDGVAVKLAEGYRILSAIGDINAALGVVMPAAWAGAGVTFK